MSTYLYPHIYVCTQTVYIQRGHEHKRKGGWSENGLGSLRGAPLHISRCLGAGVDAATLWLPYVNKQRSCPSISGLRSSGFGLNLICTHISVNI